MTDEPRKNDDPAESLLARMPLRHPPLSLDARIQRILHPSRNRPRPLVKLGLAASLLISASVAAVVLSRRGPLPSFLRKQVPNAVPPQPVIASIPAPKPISATQTIARVVNDGVIGTWENAPLQRIRRISFRQFVVVDPSTGQRLSVTVPHEEIIVTRVEPF